MPVMENTVTINKWGSSEGIRLPKVFCRQLNLQIGDEVLVRMQGDAILIEKKPTTATIQERMRDWDGVRLDEREADWGVPVGGELW